MKRLLLIALLFGVVSCTIEPVQFTAKTEAEGENLTFFWIPDHDEPKRYFVYYAIGADAETLQIHQGWVENVSSERPIRLVVTPYYQNVTYSVDMDIKDQSNAIVYTGDVFS